MDVRIKDKITELTGIGVRRVSEMRRHLRHFVETVLFDGSPLPAQSDARFWPSSRAIINCMYRTAVSLRCDTHCIYYTSCYLTHYK